MRTPTPAPSPPSPGPADPGRAVVDRRPNRAGTQRVRRLAIGFAVAVAVVYGTLAAVARTAPSGGTVGGTYDLDLLGEIALAIGVAGAVVTLFSAPVAVERDATTVVAVGPFGTRRAFRLGPKFAARVVRRYAGGLLSDGAVESVELTDGRRRRTYLLEAGILEPPPP